MLRGDARCGTPSVCFVIRHRPLHSRVVTEVLRTTTASATRNSVTSCSILQSLHTLRSACSEPPVLPASASCVSSPGRSRGQAGEHTVLCGPAPPTSDAGFCTGLLPAVCTGGVEQALVHPPEQTLDSHSSTGCRSALSSAGRRAPCQRTIRAVGCWRHGVTVA